MVKIVMLVLQTRTHTEDGLMENDKDETWERLKKPYLTIEQKKDIIQELNGKRFEEEWNKLLSEITELARENGIRIPTDEE